MVLPLSVFLVIKANVPSGASGVIMAIVILNVVTDGRVEIVSALVLAIVKDQTNNVKSVAMETVLLGPNGASGPSVVNHVEPVNIIEPEFAADWASV